MSVPVLGLLVVVASSCRDVPATDTTSGTDREVYGEKELTKCHLKEIMSGWEADLAWSPETLRRRLNGYPPYAGACIEVTHIAEDASEIRVRMPLEASNTNLVGTHFGGSLYAMVDPHLMILLMRRLGPDYVVWDQSATIDFLRPGRSTVYATIRVTDAEVEAIRAATEGGEKHLPEWTLEIEDDDGQVVARVLKTLYVRRRRE